MKSMPLYRRFIGSIKDKILILLIFIVGFSVVEGTKKGEVKSFTYLTLFVFSPSDYSYIHQDVLFAMDYGYLRKYSQLSDEEIQEKYKKTNVAQKVKSFDLTITFSFIFLNVLYYLFSEIFLGASIGKYRMKGRLVDNLLGERISTIDAFKRAIIGGLLMTLFVGIRFFFDTNYIIIILLYFLFIDIPVFIKQRSLIDMLSKVSYVEVEEQSSIVAEMKGSNENKAIEEKGNDIPMQTEKMLETTNDTKKESKFHFPNISISPSSRTKDYSKMKKALIYTYLIWFAINLMALSYALANPYRIYDNNPFDEGEIYTGHFFPFESSDIGSYDFSEFIVYIVAIPLCLFAMIKLFLLFRPRKSQ